jgi:acetyl-CoA carboxylase biotin carboxyl carrier protein
MRVDALVAQLSGWLAGTDIVLFELRGPEGTLRLVRDGEQVSVELLGSEADGPEGTAEPIVAPFLGVFLARHPLRHAPATAPGTRHRRGDVIGFLRVGPALVAVHAPFDGVMQDVLASEGETVGFGATLFAMIPFGAGETP